MTTPSNEQPLEGLVERVRAATGPDRKIEEALVEMAYSRREAMIHKVHDLATHRYTASIDAALALADRVLPPRWEISMSTSGEDDMPWACATEPDEPCRDIGASAPTIPLAILLALLTALQSTHSGQMK